jgi:hypothetical protein
LAILICGVIAAATGCRKSEQAEAPAASAVVATNQPAQVFGNPARELSPAPVAAVPGGGADLRELNHVYIRWVLQSHRHAKTFEEFVAASGVNVPPAPNGKKYIIDKAGFIALADR